MTWSEYLAKEIEKKEATQKSKCPYWNAEHEDCTLNYAEIRAKVIDKFCKEICCKVSEASTLATYPDGIRADVVTADCVAEIAFEIAEQMKKGGAK